MKIVNIKLMLGVCFLVGGSLACDKHGSEKLKVGLVPDSDSWLDDNTFNQAAWEGGMRAVREFGIFLDFAHPQKEEEYQDLMEVMVDDGYDLIISIGFLVAEATLQTARKYPDVYFAAVDVAYDEELTNLAGLVFRDDQVGYLVGVLAAQMTDSETVCCIGGMEIPPVKRFCNGYKQGVASQFDQYTSEIVWVGDFNDGQKGRDAVDVMVTDKGCDVLFGVGGAMSSAALLYSAKTYPNVWLIGVDMDEYYTTFQNGTEPGVERLLTSAMKHVDVAVYETIKNTLAGEFHGSNNIFGAADAGVGLAPFHDAADSIPQEVKELLDTTLAGLAAGTIDTGVDELGNIK